MNEKLAELMKDENFTKELLSQETAEDTQKFLASKGVEFTIEEIESIRAGVIERINNNSEELNESQLEQVAGGSGVVGQVVDVVVDGVSKLGDLIHTVTRGRW